MIFFIVAIESYVLNQDLNVSKIWEPYNFRLWKTSFLEFLFMPNYKIIIAKSKQDGYF